MALEPHAPLGILSRLPEQRLGDGDVGQDARQPLGVQQREREIALRVPLRK
jgi:hypothetical protein